MRDGRPAEMLYLDGRPLLIQYTADYKTRRAREIVDAFLATAGVLPAYPNTASISCLSSEDGLHSPSSERPT